MLCKTMVVLGNVVLGGLGQEAMVVLCNVM